MQTKSKHTKLFWILIILAIGACLLLLAHHSLVSLCLEVAFPKDHRLSLGSHRDWDFDH